MNSTDKVLGQIAAMHTFVENFPMDILDIMRGKTYTSIFDFMIDVLYVCGVNVDEIIIYLLSEIYGIDAGFKSTINEFYDQIKDGKISINEQSKFIKTIEESIKVIIMGLLSSIYGCSAIPIIPNWIMDNTNYGLMVSKNMIDPMGILDISPTSSDGRLFYAVEGGDKYYKKQYVEKEEIIKETRIVESGVTTYQTIYSAAPLYDKNVKVFFSTTSTGDEYSEDTNIFKTESGVNADVLITVKYSPYGSKNVLTWESVIPKGNTTTREEWICSPVDMFGQGQRTIIHSVSINGNSGGADVGNKTWVYLSKGESNNFYSKWNNNGLDSIEWGGENLETEEIEITSAITATTEIEIEEDKKITKQVLEYLVCDFEEVDENVLMRVDFVPQSGIDEKSSEYIVCYEGLNPNTLYKTYDMNSFLWYALHKGMSNPQVEYNHMMWDSRISAREMGIERKTPSEWNKWYNSKKNSTDEFKYFDAPITENSPIYPIMQLEPTGPSETSILIQIPAQRYFKPKKHLNASIYKYNWEYLNNIQILQPKILLVGLCESLLGFSLSTISSININLTKKIIEAKLSSAIKAVIEADDMEVEDCYTEFSNDEINTMLEEMLLSRYNATTYGGETATVRVHDTQKYIDMLDKINTNASVEGNITQITKLVTEVTADPRTEGSIDYGIQLTTDNNILKKLLWAIAMPILLSIFTPQVLLLLYMNFDLMGITRMDSFAGNDFGKILNLIMNKIFGLVKSILIFIKDKIIELLLVFFYREIQPILGQFILILLRERLLNWLTILTTALAYLPKFKLRRNKIMGAIEDVNYADIINTQNTPESTTNC